MAYWQRSLGKKGNLGDVMTEQSTETNGHSKESRYAYIGIKACGCVVAAAVDDPRWTKDTAKDVAKWMKAGLTIERKPVEWVREKLNFCDCGKKTAPLEPSLFTSPTGDNTTSDVSEANGATP